MRKNSISNEEVLVNTVIHSKYEDMMKIVDNLDEILLADDNAAAAEAAAAGS